MTLVLSWSSLATMAKPAWAYFNPGMYIIGGILVPRLDPIASSTVALVSLRDKGMSLCTGSIIDTDLILTAAHCVGPSPSHMLVFFGADLNGKPDKVAHVTAYLRNPEYGEGYSEELDQDLNDIALVRFEGGIPPGYAAAQILDDIDALVDGAAITLAGYGRSVGDLSEHEGPDGSGMLRMVETTIRTAYHGQSEVLTEQSQGRGACHGDSGGPAFIRGLRWPA
jgi:secreted trypsin-like serine protease